MYRAGKNRTQAGARANYTGARPDATGENPTQPGTGKIVTGASKNVPGAGRIDAAVFECVGATPALQPVMARKKSRAVRAVVVREAKTLDHRAEALAPSERRLNFGDRWSYAPAPEAHDYIKLQSRYRLFIGGKFVTPHLANISIRSIRRRKKNWPRSRRRMRTMSIGR